MELIVLERWEWDEIKSDIKEIKNTLTSKGMKSVQKKWISTAEAAELLNVKIRSIYNYTSKSLLNPKKIAGILLFDREEIISLIENGKQI
jgi:hypothetical protein